MCQTQWILLLPSKPARSAMVAPVKYPQAPFPPPFISFPKSNHREIPLAPPSTRSRIQPPSLCTASTCPWPPSFLTYRSCQALAGLHFHLFLRTGGSLTHRSQIMSHLGSERVSVLQLLMPPSSSFSSAPSYPTPPLPARSSPAPALLPLLRHWLVPSGLCTFTWLFPPPEPLYHWNYTD